MIKSLGQRIINLHIKPSNLNYNVWNTFCFQERISNDIVYDIMYKECIDINRIEPIDRFSTSLTIKSGKKFYTEELFYLENKFNVKENYFIYNLMLNDNKISFEDIEKTDKLLLRKIETTRILNICDICINNFKNKNSRQITKQDQMELIKNFDIFCKDLDKNPITRDIGSISTNLLYLEKNYLPKIDKNFNSLKPIFDLWTKVTGKDLLVDRQFNVFCDFILLG